MDIHDLNPEDRLRLLKFVCSFAWADLSVVDSEKAFIGRLADQLELDDDHRAQVAQWLSLPPHAEELDPNEIPVAHRSLFLRFAYEMIGADGQVDPQEFEALALFQKLLQEA